MVYASKSQMIAFPDRGPALEPPPFPFLEDQPILELYPRPGIPVRMQAVDSDSQGVMHHIILARVCCDPTTLSDRSAGP